MWLFDILNNGTLADNQSYLADQGVFSNRRLEPITLLSRETGQWNYAHNNESAIWHFLNRVSRDVEKSLSDNLADALVLFNDEHYEHNTDDGFIRVSGTDARNFTLSTGNLIGFVRDGEYSLKISSRFGDAFLRYIISDADGFLELEDFGGEGTDEGYEWLLAYLWNTKFKRAYRLGLPKAYETRRERVSSVRGSIDPVDYFSNKTSGKYLCSYREHSYDSPATSLFLAAYEVVKGYSFCQGTRHIYNAFLSANQGLKRSRRELRDVRYYKNPYFNDYNVLIDLSKKVLEYQGADFDIENKSSAFFFDISMLFEYFIRKILARGGIRMLNKFGQRHEIPRGVCNGRKRKLEPDLVFENDGGLYVFDVKYKSYDHRYGVAREDLFQLHTYIGQYGNASTIKGCGFIYPVTEDNWERHCLGQTDGLISDVIMQHGKEIPFHVLFLKIPGNSATEFNRSMREQCLEFLGTIRTKVIGSTIGHV